MSNQPQQQQGAFKKDMRKIDIWALALGAIIGWGTFVMPGTNFLPKAGPSAIIGLLLGGAVMAIISLSYGYCIKKYPLSGGEFVYADASFLPKAGPSAIIGLLLGGAVMAIISLSYGYCIKKYPLSGGEFVYADASFGKKHAFACGWMIVLGYWSLIPLNSTAIGMITRYIFPGVFQFGHMYTIAGWDVYLGEVLLSSAFIVVLGYMNVKGVKSAGWFQSTVAVLLVGSVLFCVIGVLLAKPDFSNMQPFFAEISNGEVVGKGGLACIVAVLLVGSVLFCVIGVLLAKPDFSNMQPFFAEISNGEVVGKGGLACIIAVACYAPYCFVGFDCIPQAAEEYSFSHKAAKALMVGAILVGALIYAAMVFVTAVVEPWGPMMLGNPDWATGQAVQNTIGYVGLWWAL